MPKNRGWFRVYDRMIDSPEILELTDAQFRVIVSLWALASAGGEENGAIEYKNGALWRRVAPQISKDDFIGIVDALVKIGLLVGNDGQYMPNNWAKHQYLFDSKKPSVRKLASKRREATGKPSGSHREVAGKQDTDSDTDTDTEKKQIKNIKKRFAPDVLLLEDEFQKLVDAYGEQPAREMIEMLDNYKGSSGRKYKSDYKAILSWVVSKWTKEKGNGHDKTVIRCAERPGNGSAPESEDKVPKGFWA